MRRRTALVVAALLATRCRPEPRAPGAGGPGDFCGELREMLDAADRRDLCALQGEDLRGKHGCFGETPPRLGAPRWCHVDDGLEGSPQMWCGLPAEQAGASLLAATAARIDDCLSGGAWRKSRNREKLSWWRAGDEFGRMTGARLEARFHRESPGVPAEVVVTVKPSSGVRHCENLYALVHAADRRDGFAALRRRRNGDDWETDVSLAGRTGAPTTKPCVLSPRADGATQAVCAVDELPEAALDEAFQSLADAARSCLWAPMWQQRPRGHRLAQARRNRVEPPRHGRRRVQPGDGDAAAPRGRGRPRPRDVHRERGVADPASIDNARQFGAGDGT